MTRPAVDVTAVLSPAIANDFADYKAGKLTLTQLAARWSNRRMGKAAPAPKDITEAYEQADSAPLIRAGSWDEIRFLRNIGLLSAAEYRTISLASDPQRPDAQAMKVFTIQSPSAQPIEGGAAPAGNRTLDTGTTHAVTASYNEDEARDESGKWTSGGGSGGKAEGLTEGQLNAIAGHLREFDQQGGSIEAMENNRDSVENWSSLFEDQKDLVGDEEYNKSDGVRFTQYALEAPMDWGEDTAVLIAQAEGMGIAGAINTVDMDVQGQIAMHIDYLGTTGIISGAGTALAVGAARMAADAGVPVMGEPTGAALPFWRDKMGWHEDPLGVGSDMWGWTAAEAKQVAAVKP